MDKKQLLEIEHGFWQAEVDYYRAHTAGTATFVFPGMVMEKEEGIAMIKNRPGWSNLEITKVKLIILSKEVAVLAYHASASREGNENYSANITTIYKKESERPQPLMAFHQHTPDPVND